MRKPYKLVCNSKKKKPSLIGRYTTLIDAEKALEVYKAKNARSRELEKKYPSSHIEDLFCDLKIICT